MIPLRRTLAALLAMLALLRLLPLALVLSACTPAPEPANPALWSIEGPNGAKGWLFGTIHALERPARWRTAKVDAALRDSDRMVVEIADLGDAAAVEDVFDRLARTPGQPPLSARLPANEQGKLATALSRAHMKDGDFGSVETWAAALMLARAQMPGSENGIDRAVIAAAGTRPVEELEGTEAQLGIFDRLPERDQRTLLAAVVDDAGALSDDGTDLAEAWRKGDMVAIEKETRAGLLADPDLRAALFTQRNAAWAGRIGAMLRSGERPFVAVGAAHMAGPEGLPAQLAAQGFTVTRIE
jgi:uncharacterized protein YbaP (TraB family)